MTTKSNDQFAVVRVPSPGPGRDSILRGAVMVGNLDAVMEQLPDTRARTDAMLRMYRIADDAVEAEARRDVAPADARRARDEARDIRIQQISDTLTRLTSRVDAMEKVHVRRIKDYLDSLPDPDKPDAPDQDHPTHSPSGELHSVGPVQPRYLAPETEVDAADGRDGNGVLIEPHDPTGASLQLGGDKWRQH
jgi:hypothetical protein